MSEIKKVPIDKIKTNNFRVRTTFDEEKLQMLTESIKKRGILYPLVVKPLGDGTYKLITGERRLLAAKRAGLTEVPIIERKEISKDYEIIEMGIENLQREDLSYYERGRWVAEMLSLGWTISSLSEETGIPKQSLSDWHEFYKESERIKKCPIIGQEFEPEKLPLAGLLEVKRAPIPEEKKTELAVEASKMPEPPSVTEIQRATRLIEQEPTLSAREALERARGITVLVPIPVDLMPKLKAQADEWGVSIQEAIIQILRDYLE
jgi:ParB/RepB/Spo0J family partition protein